MAMPWWNGVILMVKTTISAFKRMPNFHQLLKKIMKISEVKSHRSKAQSPAMISWKRQPTSLKVKTLSKWIIEGSQGHHQRSWEQCGYRAAHLHHGWSICPLKSLRSNDLFNEALLALWTTWKYLYQNSNPSLLPFCSPIFWWNLTNQHKLGPDFAWAQQPPHLHQRQLLCRMVAGSQGTSRPYSAFLRWKNILSTRVSMSCL